MLNSPEVEALRFRIEHYMNIKYGPCDDSPALRQCIEDDLAIFNLLWPELDITYKVVNDPVREGALACLYRLSSRLAASAAAQAVSRLWEAWSRPR